MMLESSGPRPCPCSFLAEWAVGTLAMSTCWSAIPISSAGLRAGSRFELDPSVSPRRVRFLDVGSAIRGVHALKDLKDPKLILPSTLGTAGMQKTIVRQVASVAAQRVTTTTQNVTSFALSQSIVTFILTDAIEQQLYVRIWSARICISHQNVCKTAYIMPTPKRKATPILRRNGMFSFQTALCGRSRIAMSRIRLIQELARSLALELTQWPPPGKSLFQVYSRGTQPKIPMQSPEM